MRSEYYHTKDSVEEYINMAKDVDGGELIEILNEHIFKGASILELGSGPGSDYQILSQDYHVFGSDYSGEFLNHLRVKYPDGEFLHLDAITLKTEKKFDGVYSNKVLQHLSNEELKKSISQQFRILNNEGLVCHSFWKGEGDEMFKGMFVNYQTVASLRSFFEKKFNVLVLEEYKEFEEADSILIIAKKKAESIC